MIDFASTALQEEVQTIDPPERRPAPQRKVRVGMLAACPFPANHGTPGSIREMSEAMADLGHDVHVVTYHFGEDIPVKGVRLHRIGSLTGESQVVVGPTVRRPLYDLQMIFKTLQVIKEHRLEVLHAHGYEAALVAWFCKMATGVPVVYSGHNTMGDELASYDFIRPKFLADGLAKFLDAWVPRVGDRCVPHSRNIETFFRGMGLSARTVPVIDFGIDLDVITNADPIDVRAQYNLGDGPLVVYAGVMDQFQRLDLLLEAMSQVVKRDRQAKLLMIVTIPCEDHMQRIRTQAEKLGVSDHVVLTPPQPLSNVGGMLKSCDLAVVPRPVAPGFPIKLLNYMAAKRPCVMFRSSSSGLTHRENAFLVASDTGKALGEAISEIIENAPLRERLSEEGYRFVCEHNDRRVTAEKLTGIYTDLLDSFAKRGPRRFLARWKR